MNKKISATKGNAAGNDIYTNEAPSISIQSISGGTNIVGSQGDVHVQISTQTPKRPRLIIQPGEEHITEEQKICLTELRNEWMNLHSAIKKSPLPHNIAWMKINKAAGTTSYHLILKSRFNDAVSFVKKEMAKLRSMKSAPAKDADWRAKRIGAIKARCKNQLGNIDAYKPYIKKAFHLDSLSELSTDELQKTYTYVMAKKKSL